MCAREASRKIRRRANRAAFNVTLYNAHRPAQQRVAFARVCVRFSVVMVAIIDGSVALPRGPIFIY